MDRLKATMFVLTALSLASIWFYGCQATGLATLPPVFPVPENNLPVGDEWKGIDYSETNTNQVSRAIEGITVSIEYWSTYRLNRTYNRGNTVSPFYFEEAWHQGDKTDAFYVTITNDRDKPIYFKPEACSMKDDREYYYTGLTYNDIERKIKYKLGRDIRVNSGLQKAKEILLASQLVNGEIASKQTVEGFVPFNKIARTAAKVFITLVIEKAPETEIGRYQKLDFHFPFIQDPMILASQPAVQRY